MTSGTSFCSILDIHSPMPCFNEPSMPFRIFQIGVPASILALGLALSAQAQTASPERPDDDTIVLSPFVITSETERGYQAKETLAGMRIKTDLKDVGAAIDVLTEQFLDDVGAVDMNQVLKYVANMQYADFPGGGSGDLFNQAQWYSASYVSRGVVGSSVLTDFFLTGSVPIDRYNTDNLTMLRGPNAILFGIGSPSGIVGSSTKRANLGRDAQSLRLVVDTFGSARTEFDVSRVLARNRLALRFAAVASDQHTDQDPSLNRRKASYGTVTWRLLPRTTLTINGELGIYDRYFAMNNLVADGYTPWVTAGKPTVNFLTGKGMTNGSTTKGQFPTSVGSGLANLTGSSYLTYIDGAGLPVMDWRNMARGALWNETVTAGNPGTGLIHSADRSMMNYIPFTRENAIVDLRANVWGGVNRNDLDYTNRSIFLEQNLARDLDLEMAWNRFDQEYVFEKRLAAGGATVYVDPNELLPDGRPNPYVGMPYLETTLSNAPRRSREWREYEARRATLSYKLDLDHRKLWRRIGLGNYRFAGMYQNSEYDQKLVASRWVNVTPLPGTPVATPLYQNVNRINRRSYLAPGQSTYGGYTWFNLFQQDSVPGSPVAGPIRFEERASDESPRNNEQVTDSVVGALQANWWQSEAGYHRITALYGRRRDRQRDRAQSFVRQANGEYNAPYESFQNLEDFGTWAPTTRFEARTKTYNVTFRPLSSLRLFYNYSDIFRATTAANFFDVFGRTLRPAVGETRDWGFKLDLWNDRLFFSATKYETGVIDSTYDNTGTLRQPINDIYNAIGRPDLVLERPFSYRNDISTGYEYSLTARPLDNWQVRLTFGTQKTVPTGAFDDWVEYFAQNRAFWQSNGTTPMLNPSSGYRTVSDAIALADTRLRDARATNGVQPRDQRPRNATFNTSYTIGSGLLKSLRLGGGCQWAARNVLGYARDSVGNLDTSRVFRGAERFSTDAFLGYGWKLFRGRVTWDMQLNIYNLLDTDPLLARQAVDDGKGQPLVVLRYLQTPRYLQLTNTFKF